MCRIIRIFAWILPAVVLIVAAAGCVTPLQAPDAVYELENGISSESEDDLMDIAPEMIPLTESPAMFTLPMPAATGSDVYGNATAEIDVSNTKDGYVMVRYISPVRGAWRHNLYLCAVFRTYQIGVYENVSSDRYATVISATKNVRLTDEFAPFLRSNQYVNYTANSKTIEKSAEITGKCTSVTEKIAAVYHYVTGNISYDEQLAADIKIGVIRTYLPD